MQVLRNWERKTKRVKKESTQQMEELNYSYENSKKETDDVGIEYVEPTIKVHEFHEKIMDTDIYFQVIKLQDSFHLWIGKSKLFGDLSVAMTMAGKTPSSSVLIGQSDSHTVLMAPRLSKTTGKQVFVSGNFNFDRLEIPLVEKRIAEEMKNHPDRF